VVQVRVEVVEPDYSDVLAILESMNTLWISIFTDIGNGTYIASDEETKSENGVEVNASKDVFCELNNTGKRYYRPINASCVTNDPYNAWKCDPGYLPV
jgi:hypothetical protein